ncbi:MAG TPA: MFS transporter, partial [Burkholderiales bacterium]|nr:MFS transporter [Burkholderiales bacterium]
CSTVAGLYWLTSGGHRFPWASAQSGALLAVACGALIALVVRERKHPAPFLPVDLLREKAILYSLLTTLMFASCMFAMVFFLPIYLQLGHRVSPLLSGLLLLPLTAGMVCGSLTAARFVARTGQAKWVPVAGLSLAGFALLMLGAVAPAPGVVGLLGFLAGLGFGVIMPINQVVVQTVAGPARLGAVTAMISLFRSVGGAAGAAVFGAIVYALLPDVDHIDTAHSIAGIAPLPVLHAFHIAFLLAAGVAFAGAVAASRIPLVSLWQPKVARVAKETLAPVDGA